MNAILPYRIAVDDLSTGGASVAQKAATIVADLAARPEGPLSRQFVTITLGTNDANSLPAEAAWKADAATILDAIHVKWPYARVGWALPWHRDRVAACNTLAGWIADVIAPRSSWAFVGPDERVYLENGDNGVTYTTDGTHPNVAGYTLAAAQWQTALGY